MRDRTVGDTFYIAFTTRAFATGIPTVLAGSPVISAYEDGSLTQITAGITVGLSHDGVVGLNMLTIVATSGNTFESGKDYQLVITAGTVGGVSVIGEVVGQFSLGLSAAVKDLADVPTVAEFNARTLPTASYFDPAADTVANVTTVATTTTNTDMRGTDGANTVVPPTVAQFNARTLISASYFDPATDTVANVTTVGVTTTNTDMRGTEGANTTVPPTVAQFNARTLVAADYFDPASDTVALVNTTTNVTNQVTADVTAISGGTAAADNLEASMETLVLGAATGTPTITTMADSSQTESTNDHYNGRIIIWRTGLLKGQATDITGYNGATKVFTFTTVTEAATAGDLYVIV